MKTRLNNDLQMSVERFKSAVMTAEQRAELIENTSWMKDLKWSQVLRFADFIDVYEIGTGETLYTEGNRELYMGLIADGDVSVRKMDLEGNTKDIARLGPGKTFGEMALIDGHPRSATVKTLSPVTLLALKKEKFDLLIEQAPKLAVQISLKISKLMSERLRQTSGRLIDYLEQ